MKKQLLSITLAGFLFLGLSSCGEENSGTTTTVPSTTTTVPSTTTTTMVSVPTTDPYVSVSTDEFYSNYTEALSYEDANYRTKHYLMSGSIEDEDRYYLPTEYTLDTVYKVSDTTLTYRSDNTYESYTINYTDGTSDTIFYGGAYVSLNEVCAYIYAFGEVPPNSNYTAKKKSQSVKDWNKYGRCNIGGYSNDTTKYKFEPELPTKSASGYSYKYTETDFGSTGGFMLGGRKQSEYNNGSNITRGTCRIVFTNNAKSIEDRHVFYTYNHYNDFQEYLNYGGGFGTRFGNESNGGSYNNGSNPSSYIKTTSISMKELRRLLGYV